MGNPQLGPRRATWSWVWIAALCLTACQPDYARDSSKALLAESGLTNRFKIERSNNRALPIQSFLCIASDDASTRRALVLDQTRQALARYFADVSVVRPTSQAYASKADIACRGASFLIQVELETANCRPEDEATAPAADAGTDVQTEGPDEQAGKQTAEQAVEQPVDATRQAQFCRSAHVRWQVMPLASDALVDTLDIHYQRSWVGLQSGELESLLEPGLRAAARALAGR